MYAVIQDRGRQYRAEAGSRLVLDRLQGAVGSEVALDVLLVADGDQVEVGSPLLDGRSARCKIISHERGSKGMAGTYKRRQDQGRRVGFRREHTRVEVLAID